MPQTLLSTQLYLPAVRSSVVARPRLIGRLDQGFLPPLENLSTILINALSDAKHSLILVFDDYHFIENKAIDKALAFLFAKRG
jgi:ATP/maltotriose-dependent transcriptional regulator MalT